LREKNGGKKRMMPVYWPAEFVPYTSISYCHMIQGVFGVLLISCIGYVIFGLG
jgi:hypothetical protein